MNIPDTGMIQLSFSEYQKLDRVNHSRLKLMERSPAHYAAYQRKDTDALKQGRACHAATLEPEKYESQYVVWDGVRRGKDWEAFREQHESFGREIITPTMDGVARTIAGAVRSHPLAKPYLVAGAGEHTLLWADNDTALKCKARPDFVSMAGAIVDLKCVRDASPRGFARAVANYAYHEQAAFYVDGYRAVTGRTLPYVIIAVEWDIPYAVTVYRLPDDVVERGRENYRAHLEMLAECQRTGAFPAYSNEELTLELPAWAMPEDEEDLSGLGLEIGA